MSAFHFPTTRARRVGIRAPLIIKAEKPAKETMGLIQGKQPGSIEEWRLAVALWKYKIQFYYQVPIRGGWVLGGYIVDFVAFTPFARAIELFGKKWHSMTSEDQVRLAMEFQEFHSETTVIWDYEVPNQAAADEQIAKLL